MIRINLLPYHLRPVKRTPLPYLVVFAVLGLAVLAMASIYLGTRAQVSAKRAELDKTTQELGKLKEVVDENNALVKQKESLAGKMGTIQEIVADRIIWSRQLFNISRLTPDNFWYDSITEKEIPITRQVKVFDEKTKKEETKTETIKNRVLQIGGYTVEGQDGNRDIYPLTFKMEQDPEFSALFQLNQPKFKDTQFEAFSVRNFTLEYNIAKKEEPAKDAKAAPSPTAGAPAAGAGGEKK